ncbi:MAG: hypothetical protein ABL993_04450 [Vicinamibacterales bacterium]
MTRCSYVVFVSAAIALLGGTASATDKTPEPLAIKTSGAFAPAESDVIVRMRVERDPRARELTIEWVSDDLSGGSHAISLDGGRAAITHQYAIKKMSAGEYTVTAILRLSDGTEVRRASRVTIVGMGAADRGFNGGAQGSSGLRPGGQR